MSFLGFLRRNTGVTVIAGPFVDVGDGFTPQTDITLAGNEAELLKHSSATVVDISGRGWVAVASCRGYFQLGLLNTDVDTEGLTTIVIQDDSDCLPVRHTAQVVNTVVYDALYAASGTDYLNVDLNVDQTGVTVGWVNVLVGHTAQTGDSFARLGGPAGASVSADIADIPTVAEFNARSLVSADYTIVGDLGVVQTADHTAALSALSTGVTVTTNADKTGYDLNADQTGVTIAGATNLNTSIIAVQAAVDTNGVDINSAISNQVIMDGKLTALGTGVTLTAAQPAITFTSLTVTGALTVSDGIVVTRSTGDQPAIKATGNGASHGLELIGGSTGYGAKISGGAVSGPGMVITGGGNGSGLNIIGTGPTGYGATVYSNALSGVLVYVDAADVGINAVEFVNGATSGNALQLTAAGSGSGINTTGGATGHGIKSLGGITSGNGINATAQANNDAGMKLIAHGTGLDIDADNITSLNTGVTVSVNSDKTGYSLAADQTGVTIGLVDELGATAKASVNTAVDSALDTAIVPAAVTPDSMNDWIARIKEATVNKLYINETTGDTMIFADDDATGVTVPVAFSSASNATSRKRLER